MNTPNTAITPPVALADIHAYLQITGNDEDDLITTLIHTASTHLEYQHGIALITRTEKYRRSLDKNAPFILPLTPVTAITEIILHRPDASTQILNADDWQADLHTVPAKITLTATDRNRAAAANDVEISYQAGFGENPSDIPLPLRLAVKTMVGHWLDHRLDPMPGTAVDTLIMPLIAPWRRRRL